LFTGFIQVIQAGMGHFPGQRARVRSVSSGSTIKIRTVSVSGLSDSKFRRILNYNNNSNCVQEFCGFHLAARRTELESKSETRYQFYHRFMSSLLEKFTKVQKDSAFWDLYARKMLVKSTLGIDFINILRVTF
jgi:hypothetical protein